MLVLIRLEELVVSALAIKKSYVVYLGGHSHGPDVTTDDLHRVTDSHYQLLASFVGSEEEAKDAIFYSYKRHINGFAAILEEDVAAEIAKHPDVVSVFLNQAKKLHTTHSWDFLMLEQNGVIQHSWKKARLGADVIIANLDTGVWPELDSFSDKGFGPIPSRWKGTCHFDDNTSGGFKCNRKLIGARYFNKGFLAYYGYNNSTFNTPRDVEGHGSHTLSTAAGNFVPGASVFGIGNGTAKGGSPRARVASYKVCWPVESGGCFDSDILAAFDMAIHDGVDVFSVSVGGGVTDYFNDGLAIGAFHAVQNGRVVIASAGNEGPYPGSVSNVAPWIITVGASTLDREFHTNVKLEHGGDVLVGTSLSKALPNSNLYPLISAAHAKAPNVSAADAILCKPDTLDSKKVKGKILVCLRGENARVNKGQVAVTAGAAGMILCNDEASGNELIADAHMLPSTHITYKDGLVVFSYVNNTKDPKGLIEAPETQLKRKPAPFMAAFSSRGPNLLNPEILKPDITAPGVNIIAGYTLAVSPTRELSDTRRSPFNTMSGTSMSCPHVAGIVGLLKSLHPKWSPSAIRSAIMTTARTRDNTVHPMQDADHEKATPFAYGSGHIQPHRAMDPGLVYDLTTNDYLDFLCSFGYDQESFGLFVNNTYNCPKEKQNILNFNNPSITVPNLSKSMTVTRKLKNVGTPGKYVSRVRHPHGYSVTVKPKILRFNTVGEEKTFKVTIRRNMKAKASSEYKFGELLWSDGKHYVRSPIVVSSAHNH